MNIERIRELQDSGVLSSEEAQRISEALMRRPGPAEPLPGVTASWIALFSGWLGWISMLTYSTRPGRTYGLLQDGEARLWVGLTLSTVSIIAWLLCRRTELYRTSPALRGRAVAGFSIALAISLIVIPGALMALS